MSSWWHKQIINQPSHYNEIHLCTSYVYVKLNESYEVSEHKQFAWLLYLSYQLISWNIQILLHSPHSPIYVHNFDLHIFLHTSWQSDILGVRMHAPIKDSGHFPFSSCIHIPWKILFHYANHLITFPWGYGFMLCD